jgi:DNA-binding response OmpR family regulator
MASILLVEDEIKLAEIVQRELELAGYQVWHAADGKQALQLFQSRDPDLLVLDWNLPEINGLDVLRRIRMKSAVPVLMLTARGDPSDRVVGLEVGADDYLVKPFHLPELVARVRALLRRAERIQEMLKTDQSPSQALLEYADLILDPQSYTCRLEGQPLDLTPIEFEMLSLLLSHPGRTFNRMYLVETIWKSAYLEGDRAVDNAILRLRKKLGKMGDYLETVRGLGYRMRRLDDSPGGSRADKLDAGQAV